VVPPQILIETNGLTATQHGLGSTCTCSGSFLAFCTSNYLLKHRATGINTIIIVVKKTTTSNIKHQTSNIKHQTSIIKHQSSNIKHQPNTKHQTPNTECQTPNVQCHFRNRTTTTTTTTTDAIAQVYSPKSSGGVAAAPGS
jgi:hypothetical protein